MNNKISSAKRRANPFVFPPETNAFFTLLALTGPIWMLELGRILQGSLGQNLFSTYSLMLLVVFLAVMIYLSHPNRIRYRQNLRSLTRNDDPKFVDAIHELVDECQILSPPGIEVAADSRTVDGQAFGLWRNYSLRLGGRSRLLFRQDPQSFRAIILHELAHIVNADIGRAYFTQALWTAVIILTVIPFIGVLAYYFLRIFNNQADPEMAAIAALSIFKVGGALLIVTAMYSNVLRAREYYADWRAALWGAGQALEKILHRNIRQTTTWKHKLPLWRLHPTASERIEVLQDPEHLFHLKPMLAFFMGTLFGLMFGVFSLGSSGWSLFVIPGLTAILLISNSLSLAVQRETLIRLEREQNSWTTVFALCTPAVLIAVGFQVGNLLTISSILELLPSMILRSDGRILLLYLFFLTVLLAFLTWAALAYVSIVSRQLLGSHAGKSVPKWKMRLLTLALYGILLLFYIPTWFVQFIYEEAASRSDPSSLSIFFEYSRLLGTLSAILFVALILLTGLSIGIYRWLRKLKCHSCGQRVHQAYAVGNLCENCGDELASWLYIT